MTEVSVDSIFPSLEAQAARLNKASDRITPLLANLEERLVKLNVGLEVWYRRPIESTVSEGDIGPHATRSKTVQVLGLARVDGKWCLAVKPIRRVSSFYDGDMSCPCEDDFAAGPPVPLLQTSRSIRIAALRAMPDFLNELQGSLADAVTDIETAVSFPKSDRKETIHSLLRAMVTELLEYIKEQESSFPDRWVPAADIRNALELNFVAVPKQGEQYGEKGWLFAILARMLEDEELVDYKKDGSRAFYRSRKA